MQRPGGGGGGQRRFREDGAELPGKVRGAGRPGKKLRLRSHRLAAEHTESQAPESEKGQGRGEAETMSPAKKPGRRLHSPGAQERGQRGLRERREGRKATTPLVPRTKFLGQGLANPMCPLRGWSWPMLAGVWGHRCHFAAFIQAACLLTRRLAEEQRGRAVPRVNSKCCVTTAMAHPTQIYRIQSWTKQEETLGVTNAQALQGQGPPREVQGGGPRGAGPVTFAPHCADSVNPGRPTEQAGGRAGALPRHRAPSVTRLGMSLWGSTSNILRTTRGAQSCLWGPLDRGWEWGWGDKHPDSGRVTDGCPVPGAPLRRTQQMF